MQTTRIAVIGAGGRVGHHVADILEDAAHDVVRASRATGVDVVTGEGLDAALAGAEVIVDAATGPSPDQQEATAFFTAAARNLQAAGARAGARRVVVVSIIGIDRFAGGYNAAKLVHEQTHRAGPVDARIVRAAQFHEFVEELMRWGTQGDVAHLWEMRTQLVAARTVAEVLVDVALRDDAPAMTEVAGPREESLVAAASLLAARRGAPAEVRGFSDPDDPDHRLYREGAALPGPGAILAGPTFEAWLDATVGAGAR